MWREMHLEQSSSLDVGSLVTPVPFPAMGWQSRKGTTTASEPPTRPGAKFFFLLLQSMGGSALGLPFPQAASMALCSMQSAGSGQLPQPNGFTPQYAQQLHNQLLMQQGGLPFLNPGTYPEEKLPSVLLCCTVGTTWH